MGILVGVGYFGFWLFSPDTTDYGPDWTSYGGTRLDEIRGTYTAGEGSYWHSHLEFAWVWLKVEMGWGKGSAWDDEYEAEFSPRIEAALIDKYQSE